MSASPQVRQACRDELERVLASDRFTRAERLAKLLRFLVERRIEGRESELKESIIGVEVFARRPDYDPKQDSTVRTEAVRLRTRLRQYYANEGSRDPLWIELPKGGYVPEFSEPAVPPAVPRLRIGRLRLAVGLAAVAILIAALGLWLFLRKNAPYRIAVLPLVNLNPDPGTEYLADGLTVEIINNLSRVEGLEVRSQTSSFTFKGKQRSVRDIGRQLAADYVVEGSVLKAGTRLRITAQMVRTRDDSPVWSAQLDRGLTDVLAMQEEISLGIVNNLRLKLGRSRRRYETSAEAYDLYLNALALGDLRFPGDRDVVTLLEKAVEKDGSFAPAYAGLATAYAWRTFLKQSDADQVAELTKMRAAAQRAVQLDPLLAEAHSALGIAYARDGKWQQAERSLRRAIQIAPNLSALHYNLVQFLLLPLGRIEDAVREARAELRSEPFSAQAHFLLADALISAGRYDEASRYCEKLPADFYYSSICRGRAWLGQGRNAEAMRVLTTVEAWGYLAYAYAKAGRRDEAERLITEGPRLHPNMRGPFQQAVAYAGLGDKERTLEALERMTGMGPVRVGFTMNAPEFAFLRGDPRATALRKSVGLPE